MVATGHLWLTESDFAAMRELAQRQQRMDEYDKIAFSPSGVTVDEPRQCEAFTRPPVHRCSRPTYEGRAFCTGHLGDYNRLRQFWRYELEHEARLNHRCAICDRFVWRWNYSVALPILCWISSRAVEKVRLQECVCGKCYQSIPEIKEFFISRRMEEERKTQLRWLKTGQRTMQQLKNASRNPSLWQSLQTESRQGSNSRS